MCKLQCKKKDKKIDYKIPLDITERDSLLFNLIKRIIILYLFPNKNLYDRFTKMNLPSKHGVPQIHFNLFYEKN